MNTSIHSRSRKHLIFLLHAAAVAALYTALTTLCGSYAFGPVQFRVSEALTVLPYFTPAAIPGLFIGCLISNFLSGNIFDILFGSLATLAAALLSYALRKRRFLVTIPPVLLNMLVVPLILKFTYPDCAEESLLFLMLTVGAGQILACMVVGYPLLLALSGRVGRLLFGGEAAPKTERKKIVRPSGATRKTESLQKPETADAPRQTGQTDAERSKAPASDRPLG